MRTRNIYILSACLAAVLSCTEFQEENIEVNEAEKVAMTFTASICDETDPETKTVLDGQLGDELRKVLWSPGDEIGIAASNSSVVERFENTESENSETATFKGGVSIADTYYAGYPYSGVTYADVAGYKALIFDLPQTQKYVAGTFGKDCAPMVAKAAYEEDLQFRNLCGLLALNLTGEESVKSITFTGKDANGEAMYVSGHFVIAMTYEDVPAMEPGANFTAFSWPTNRSATLECDEPVQLSTTEATPFYFVLPPATYETFTLLITTADGKIMMKEGTKPLTIKRSDVQPTADLAYVETTVVDLSLNGHANCYIIPKAGLYSFRADVIGNGEFGLIGNANFHTADTKITPATAEILWTTADDAITNLAFDETSGYISFIASGEEGNAVIEAKDSDGNIVWSWHIWMTDQPAEHVYINETGTYTLLDRNLGALRTDKGNNRTELFESMGVTYQWGRKDPFILKGNDHDGWSEPFNKTCMHFTTLASIQRPYDYATGEYDWNSDGMTDLWSTEGKTIYDPCPTGYRVTVPDVFTIFSSTGNNTDRIADICYTGNYDEGFNFIYDGNNSAWYPSTYHFNYWGNTNYNSFESYLWTSDEEHSFKFQYGDDYTSYLYFNHWNEYANAFPVRCMKDEATRSVIVKINNTTNITKTSATFNGSVTTASNSNVTMKGFVYGNSEDVTIESGKVLECGSGSGTFTADATELTEGLYYVKAYAVTTSGTYYSPATYFIAKEIENESEKDMVFTVSANYTNNFLVKLPTWGTIQCTVEWGDGTIETYDTYDTNLTHTYNVSEPAYFDVRISGIVTGLHHMYDDFSSITKVKQWGLTGLTSMSNAFGSEKMLTELCDDTLGSFIDITSFKDAWSGCSALTEIPEGLFRYAIQATDFTHAFKETAISEINSKIFSNCSSVQTLHGIFQSCTALTSINSDLFAGCPTATEIDWIFYGCSNLSSIPSGLFDSFTNAKTFNYTFYDCSSITSIPTDLFKNCTEIESFVGCFEACSSLSAIPKELFKNNIKATDFSRVFSGCNALTAIPEGLFSNLTNATTFDYSFSSCGIESLPTGLFKDTNAGSFSHTFAWCDKLKTTNEVFDGCSQVYSFHATFNWCVALTDISENLFSSCTSAKNFNNTFYYCISLEFIPANLFNSCTLAESFNSTFCECHKLTSIPVSLFDMTRRVHDFGQCFYYCQNLTGESPYTIIDGVKYHLYERANNVEQFVTPTYSYGCFGYCRGLIDYYSIPGDWN